MVRSSGHHRKRSRSRSITPDHKRSKSSRDYDKDRPRRRSRSRDRIRRSRSRDRKKDKKLSESRVRSKPLKLKRRSRSRSRSRSKSKDKSIKKDEKKETKTEDEPFDPTNLDKVTGNEDEEWVVTDVIEEPSLEDNGNIEEEYDYEADEDDVYSHTSSPAQVSSRHSSPDVNNEQHEESSVTEEQNKDGENSSINQNDARDETLTGNVENNAERNDNSTEKKELEVSPGDEISPAEKEKIQDIVSNLKEISSDHKQKLKLFSDQHKVDKLKSRSHSNNWSHNNIHHSEEIVRITKDQIKQSMKFDKEFHELRIKNEISRHKAEMEVIRAELKYWEKKH